MQDVGSGVSFVADICIESSFAADTARFDRSGVLAHTHPLHPQQLICLGLTPCWSVMLRHLSWSVIGGN
jgi:hypothetical protein